MIMLLRKWDGSFPSMNSSKLQVWFDNSSSSLSTWILSSCALTWGCRNSAGYLGEWELISDSCTYQWRCWTSADFVKQAYQRNADRFSAERNAINNLTHELNLNMIDHVVGVELNKDPAGMFAGELESLIEMHHPELIQGNR